MRNLHERCEVVFPVNAPKLASRLRDEILGSYLKDNVKARVLEPGGGYVRVPPTSSAFNAQEYLAGLAVTHNLTV